MTPMKSVDAALELLTPAFEPDDGDWEEIVRRAGVEPAVSPGTTRRRFTRRRGLIIALAVAIAGTLVATPAFGIRGLISGLFGRTNVSFTGKIAPLEVKRDFYDLGLGAPPSMAPHAIAAQTRRVASFRIGPKTHVLWVAPTRSGGFCWEFSGAFGGCLTHRHERPGPKLPPGYINAGVLSLTYGEMSSPVGQRFPSEIGGTILTPKASALTVDFADGTKQSVGFYYVSKPIDAGFFLAPVLAGHRTWKTRALAVVLRDKQGRILSRQPFSYETAAQKARDRKRQRQQMQQLLNGKHPQQRVIPSPSLPSPSPPLQRGSANGVTAVAGRNGVVVFDTSHASAAVRPLIAGRAVDYACFRRLPYHPAPVDLGVSRTTDARVAFRLVGESPPFMGCEIQGTYGHTWPDKNGDHSAVEIAFTPAARSFFADRAAARDLALFLRSDAMHAIRKLSASALAQAIRRRYGSAITRLDSPSSSLSPDRIGFITSGDGITYVERSTTGRQFSVRIVDGRIKAQNVKPLGFVF
jgi:hypothetical protein